MGATPLYRNFTDQASIDAEYNPLLKVPETADIVSRWQKNSAQARSALTSHLGLRFGPTLKNIWISSRQKNLGLACIFLYTAGTGVVFPPVIFLLLHPPWWTQG